MSVDDSRLTGVQRSFLASWLNGSTLQRLKNSVSQQIVQQIVGYADFQINAQSADIHIIHFCCNYKMIFLRDQLLMTTLFIIFFYYILF